MTDKHARALEPIRWINANFITREIWLLVKHKGGKSEAVKSNAQELNPTINTLTSIKSQ